MVNYTEEYKKSLMTVLDLPQIETIRNKKILITGAGGLICSVLVDQLMMLNMAYGYNVNVYAAGRMRTKIEERFFLWKEDRNFHYVEYDALKPFASDIIFDYVIHGASLSSPGAYGQTPVETMLSNLIGVKNLLELIKKCGQGKLLYISSSEVYGKRNCNEPYSEEDYGYVDILNPRACYPSSKRSSETLCSAYKEEYGIDFVIVRPGHIYGPTMTATDNRAASEFLREASAGKNIIMKSAGMQLRSYCYVIDCANAILTVLLNGECGEAYNISNSESIVTIREFAECVAREAKVQIIFENATDQEKASYNLMNNSGLTSRKIEELGWKGIFNLESGIQNTLASI